MFSESARVWRNRSLASVTVSIVYLLSFMPYSCHAGNNRSRKAKKWNVKCYLVMNLHIQLYSKQRPHHFHRPHCSVYPLLHVTPAFRIHSMICSPRSQLLFLYGSPDGLWEHHLPSTARCVSVVYAFHFIYSWIETMIPYLFVFSAIEWHRYFVGVACSGWTMSGV